MMVGLVACCCPKPDAATPSSLTPEAEKAQVSVVQGQLTVAQTKGTWTPQDDAKFSASIATLNKENRRELMKDLVMRLNSDKLKLSRHTSEQVVCAPALCSGVTITKAQPGANDATGKAIPAAGKAEAK